VCNCITIGGLVIVYVVVSSGSVEINNYSYMSESLYDLLVKSYIGHSGETSCFFKLLVLDYSICFLTYRISKLYLACLVTGMAILAKYIK